MDIKKDKSGLVFVKGAVIKECATEESLYSCFEDGSKNRHVASTSRSLSVSVTKWYLSG